MHTYRQCIIFALSACVWQVYKHNKHIHCSASNTRWYLNIALIALNTLPALMNDTNTHGKRSRKEIYGPSTQCVAVFLVSILSIIILI